MAKAHQRTQLLLRVEKVGDERREIVTTPLPKDTLANYRDTDLDHLFTGSEDTLLVTRGHEQLIVAFMLPNTPLGRRALEFYFANLPTYTEGEG